MRKSKTRRRRIKKNPRKEKTSKKKRSKLVNQFDGIALLGMLTILEEMFSVTGRGA